MPEFENVVAEAAWLLHDDMPKSSFVRFGETHVLVDYSPVLLRNIGQQEVADRLARATNSMPGVAWIVVSKGDGYSDPRVVVRMCALTGSWAQPVIHGFEEASDYADA